MVPLAFTHNTQGSDVVEASSFSTSQSSAYSMCRAVRALASPHGVVDRGMVLVVHYVSRETGVFSCADS